jgi:peptidyl-prolyl cis-trans isomerase A (cyclophilin A)
MRTQKWLSLIPALAGALCFAGDGQPAPAASPAAQAPAASPAAPEPAAVPDVYRVKFQTTKGDFVIQVTKAWAPIGAERFYRLIESKFYDDCAFFRVVPGFMVQFGVNGDPKVTAAWKIRRILDEPAKKSNGVGMITYAMSTKNSRTTQVFINFGDNSALDRKGFAPFGKVVSGMDVVRNFYSVYGDMSSLGGHGPDSNLIEEQGNAYLHAKFPKLDYIKTARLVEAGK